MISRALIELSTILDNTPWLVNLPRRLILDQKVQWQCLVTTDVILSNRNTYLNLFFLSPLSLALITLITCFVLNLRLLNKYKATTRDNNNLLKELYDKKSSKP